MTRAQRLVLVASILGSFVAFLDMSVVNVALPAISSEPGRRHLGPAVDRRRLPGHARLVHPAGRIAVGPVRPQARVRGRADRIRRDVAARGDRAQRHRPDRRARAAGRHGRVAGPELARHHHRQLQRARSGQGDRHLDRLDGRRLHRGAAPGWCSRRRRFVAMGVRDQRAADRRDAGGARANSCRDAAHRRKSHRPAGRRPVRAGPGRDHLRPDRGARPRLGRSGDLSAARGRRPGVRRLPDLRALGAPSDAGLQAVRAAATSRWATSRRPRSTPAYRRSRSC